MRAHQQQAAQVRCGADAGMAEVELAPLRADPAEQFLRILGRQVAARDQRHRHVGDAADGDEVRERIEGQLGVQRRRGDVTDVMQQQHAAVGGALGSPRRAGRTAPTRRIFDIDGRAELTRQRRGEDACNGVGRSAAGERHHDHDRRALRSGADAGEEQRSG